MAQFTVLREETFDDILASLESLKTQVEAWRDKAQEWAEKNEDVAVEPGLFSSKHHALKAEAFQVAAELAKTAAELAQVAAENAETNAGLAQTASEAARDASVIAQGLSEDARDLSLQYRNEALGFRNTASTHATNAGQSATDASGFATTALGYRNQAEGFKNDAEAAAGIAVQGIHVIGRLANTGALPGSPATGDAYVIENSGTSQDEIHVWDGAQWIVFSVGSGTSWGQIGGTLADQVDLKNALDAKLPAAEKGSVNGVAELDGTGKVPSTQLPAFVDDVLEFANLASFPGTGETGKLYTALDTNKVYRWSGSAYIEVSESLALGETSGSAYRGDRGKTAYDHSQVTTGNPHNLSATDVGAEPALNADQKRKITYGTAAPSGGADGDIYLQHD